jgi:hypothetical protein
MISRELNVTYWTHKQYNPFVTSLRLRTALFLITIINIYSPMKSEAQIPIWRTLELALSEAEREILLLEDFNIHHPL